jgi:hypothetical protein
MVCGMRTIMSDRSRDNASKTPGRGRGRPFPKGNAGRPRGARNKLTRAAEELLDGEAEALTRKAINMALAGDTTALRLCLEHLVAPRRERFVRFDLPALQSPADATRAMAGIAAAVACGEITLGEAAELARLVDGYIRAVEANEFDQRLRAIEERGHATRA